MGKLYVLPPYILQRAIWAPMQFVLRFFLNVRVDGWAQVKELPKGVIFAVNHTSEFDPILVPAALPFKSHFFPFFYLSRPKSLYRHLGLHARLFYGGLFFKAWGAYPVQPGTHNYEVALAHHVKILQDNNSVCVFPEGHISKDGNLGKGRGGAAYLSWKTGKPVIPVEIMGGWQMTLYDILSRQRKITIRFGRPIPPAEIFAHCNKNPRLDAEHNDFKLGTHVIMHHIEELASKA